MKTRDYKLEAQRRKASRLLTIVDRNARAVGMPPLRGQRGVDALSVFTLRAWRSMARQNGLLPPSRDVIAIVLELVERRGEPVPRQMPLRKITPPPMPAVKARSA